MSDRLREAIERIESDFRMLREEPDKFTATTLAAARRFLALTETGPDYKRAKRQMLNYLDDELFLGLESELEGIVDWDWLTRAIVDAAFADYLTEEGP